MEFELDGTIVRLTQGDITAQEVDAVVNAANSTLVGGGGVDGAIREAGGPAVDEACDRLREEQGRLPVGEAVMTVGGHLPAKQIIHTVGPRWKGGSEGEPEKLANAYRNSLQVAVDNDLKTVAFPSISTGAYGYPINKAADAALEAVADFLSQPENQGALDEVRFVLFSEKDLGTYREAAERYIA